MILNQLLLYAIPAVREASVFICLIELILGLDTFRNQMQIDLHVIQVLLLPFSHLRRHSTPSHLRRISPRNAGRLRNGVSARVEQILLVLALSSFLHGGDDRDVDVSLMLFDQFSVPLCTLLIDFGHLSEEETLVSMQVFLGALLVQLRLNLLPRRRFQLILALNLRQSFITGS